MRQEILRDLLAEMRESMLPLALTPLVLATLVLVLRETALPPSLSGLGLLFLLLTMLVGVMRGKSWRIAAWVFVGGLYLVLLVAWAWFPGAGTAYTLILPVIAAAILLGLWPCLLLALLCNATLVAGAWVLSLETDLGTLLVQSAILWSGAFLLCLSQHAQRSLVDWAWTGHDEARRNLEQARDRQMELKQALEDLALANAQTVRLNDLLVAARQAVEDARRAKEEFVAKVSHELRTPLNMIIGFSDMILETPQAYARRLPPALLADIASIKRNSQHLASLVDDVLDLAEADAGRTRLFREMVPLVDIVREATQAVAVLFQKKGLTLATAVPPNLLVSCDHTRIRQVLLNLLSNAGRFTEKGGAAVTAELRDGLVTVRVSDTGPGMDAHSLNRLFEPFQQVDQSIRRRYGGSGLGLAISKRFVEMHGGRIWLESKPGQGSTASFTLPQNDLALDETPLRWLGPAEEYTSRTRPSLAPRVDARRRLVVVERGDDMLSLLARHLEGIDPVAAPTLAEAIRMAEDQAAAALIVNDPLSPLDADSLSALPYDIPILSCWVPPRHAEAHELGSQDYLTKPVARADLLQAIARTAPHARTILLADDDPEARQLFGRMLGAADPPYAVLQAEDGASTLALLKERQPDLLLLDLVMPNGDGFAVLQAKAQLPSIRDIPVIIVSAQDPEREPIVSKTLTVTRQHGLSLRDLILAISAITETLQPRFGAPEPPGTGGVSPACA